MNTIVTQKDMIIEIHGKVAKIEEHLRNLNGTIKKHDKKIDDIDTRVDGLDKKQDRLNIYYRVKSWGLTGSCTIVGILVTYLIGKF